eukprot:scaffold2250_cov399-Prasinococcus_capsulatus_cf.AAC.5
MAAPGTARQMIGCGTRGKIVALAGLREFRSQMLLTELRARSCGALVPVAEASLRKSRPALL